MIISSEKSTEQLKRNTVKIGVYIYILNTIYINNTIRDIIRTWNAVSSFLNNRLND